MRRFLHSATVTRKRLNNEVLRARRHRHGGKSASRRLTFSPRYRWPMEVKQTGCESNIGLFRILTGQHGQKLPPLTPVLSHLPQLKLECRHRHVEQPCTVCCRVSLSPAKA